MLPIPSIDYFPKGYRDNQTADVTALSDMIDYIFGGIRDEVFELAYLKQTDKCPAIYLDLMGYLFNADLKNSDSSTTKRQKIAGAIETHKMRGSWTNHAKIIIDAITGYNAEIYKSYDSDDWILGGDGVICDGTDWSILGGDGTEPYGMSLIGVGTEIEIPGNIYINCHVGYYTAVLTSAQIEKIVEDLQYDIVPAYMIIYLGYVNTSDQFVVYSGGTIS